MNKKDLRLLERVFECDIHPGRVFQSKSKEYERLEREGYVVKVKHVFPGIIPIKVEGWTLTILGNFTVCSEVYGKEKDLEDE